MNFLRAAELKETVERREASELSDQATVQSRL
jgi:hypothetical protein